MEVQLQVILVEIRSKAVRRNTIFRVATTKFTQNQGKIEKIR